MEGHTQSLVESVKGIWAGELENFEDKAEKVVALEQAGCVQDTASQVGQVDASEAVYRAGVSANAAQCQRMSC